MARTDDYLSGVPQMVANLDRTAGDRAIAILYSARKGGNQVFVVGNGGSRGREELIPDKMIEQIRGRGIPWEARFI